MSEPKDGFIRFFYKGTENVGRVYNTYSSNPENKMRNKEGIWCIGCVDDEGFTRHIDFSLATSVKYLN